MKSRRAVLVSALGALLLGCNGTAGPEAGRAGDAETGEKTADDARKYMQEQIDRYLGGQRTEEQLMKITKDVGPSLKIINQGPIQSIAITNVPPWYSEKGEKQKDGFVVSLAFAGDGWSQNVTVHLSYKGDGKWLVI